MFQRLIAMWRARRARLSLREELILGIRSGGIPVSWEMMINARGRSSLPFRFEGHDHEVRLVMVWIFETVRLFRDGRRVGDAFFGEDILRAALDRMDRDEAIPDPPCPPMGRAHRGAQADSRRRMMSDDRAGD